MRNSLGCAVGYNPGTIPWQPGERFAHEAETTDPGEDQSAADKCRHNKPPWRYEHHQQDAERDQSACNQANLPLEGPACDGVADNRASLPGPGIGSAFQHNEVPAAADKQFPGYAGARATLAYQHYWPIGIQVRCAQLNLFQRNIDGAGQMRRGKLRCRTHIYQLRLTSRGLPILPYVDSDGACCRFRHFLPSVMEEYEFWKKDSRVWDYFEGACGLAIQGLGIIGLSPAVTIDSVSNSFEIGPVHVGGDQLFLIAGPCVIESETHVRTMADAIQRITADLGVPYIFKASYDKANRTSVKSFRGPGLREGVRILGRLAKATGLPVLTDVHEPGHCEIAAEAVDVLQIPAFLCRQTDLLVAAGKTGRAVNIKKGQFVAPWDMTHPVEKVRSTGNERVFLTERGASFGYNNLVVDFRSLPVMRQMAPVVFDGTHSVQQPSAANGVSGGQPEFIPLLARAAVAAGIDGLFLEVHDDPANAKSDGANALDLKLLKPLLEKLLAIHAAAK